MCGIVGYIGNNQASKILLEMLSKLEYRGYDSAGLATSDGNNISILKEKGRIANLIEAGGESLSGNMGIAHTRWATHGQPTKENSHPHYSDDYLVIGVHNGIIENYLQLKDVLLENGYSFYSQTDTEVLIKFIHYYCQKEKDILKALSLALKQVRGSYALALMFKDDKDSLYLARKESPLILAKKDDEVYVASDPTAIINYCRDVYYLENLSITKVSRDELHFYDLDLNEKKLEASTINYSSEAAERGGYEHYMLKEIYEQPQALHDSLNAYVDEEGFREDFPISIDKLKAFENIWIVACGSAYHVGCLGQYLIEGIAKKKVRVELASEFRYREPLLDKKDLVIVISQSGETADSLAALRKAKELGASVLGIVNVLGSSIAREADYLMYTYAGPEIAVATTKAYSCQLLMMYILALALAKANSRLNQEEIDSLLEDLRRLPELVSKAIEKDQEIKEVASKVAQASKIFFIGRGLDYALSLEGALKMKEITYAHAEGYAAGELKHGTISLIDEDTVVIGSCSQSKTIEKTISNLVETKSRGAYIISLALADHNEVSLSSDEVIYVEDINEYFAPSLMVVVLQLLAYHSAVIKGLNVDKPRNLAKSVTVE